MNKITSRQRMLLAAVAGICGLSLARPALAQYPAGQDGHAQDANNRLGGNGYNTARTGGSGVTANDIANRNVTGGREFRGPILEKDPRAFTGPVPSGIDMFVRQSNGPSTDYGAQGTYGQPQTYYGDSRFVAPPAGSLPVGFNGGYIGTTLNTPASLSSQFNQSDQSTGLQSRTVDRETLLMTQAINSSKYDSLDTSLMLNQNGTLSISPIFGQRNYFSGTSEFLTRDQAELLAPENAGILKMQDELRAQALAPGQQPPAQPGKTDNNSQTPQPSGLNQPVNQPLGQPFDTPTNGLVSNPLTSSQLNTSPLSATGIIPSDAGMAPSLIPASQQSALLATLQSRLAQSSAVGRALESNVPKVVNQPTAQNSGPPREEVATDQGQGPVKVSSLATGIKAKGLHDTLADGEGLMRTGKFDEAIKKFNQAQHVAPNNPLPLLGRAHAELAGGYYALAENDLRGLFRSDPELLMAQFDLSAVLPKERIEFLRKDLNELTKADPKAERPWFVLAYLDYNTGDPAAADKDLAEAETRSGAGSIWSIRLLRAHWALPSGSKAAPGESATPPAIRRTTTPPAATQPARIGGSELNK